MQDFDQLWNYDDPAATEQKFRALLPAAERSVDRAYHAELLTQIARTLSLQRRFDEAHALLDEAAHLPIEERSVARIRLLLERGRAFNSAGRPAAAEPLFMEAWNLGLAAGADRYAVDAAHMIAIATPGFDEKMAWNLKALHLAEQSEAARSWVGSLLNNIGWTYAEAERYAEALAMFERCVAFFAERGLPERLRIAHWSVGKMLRLLQRVDEALAIQEALLQELSHQGTADGFVQEELAECKLAKGEAAAARPHFASAYQALAKMAWLVASEPDRLARLQRLAAD